MHEDAIISAASDAVTADAIASEIINPKADDRKSAFASETDVTTCSNCETPLKGRYCHKCGQIADTWHRPIWSLFSEITEGLFNLDGRVWRTLPSLLFRPGHLTRNYLTGKRQRYIPPFRLFLLASLVFFLAFELGPSSDKKVRIPDNVVTAGNISNKEAADKLHEAAKGIDQAGADIADSVPDGAKDTVKQITGQISDRLNDAGDKATETTDTDQTKPAPESPASTDANSEAAKDSIPYQLDMETGEKQFASRDDIVCGIRKVLVPEELSDDCKERVAKQVKKHAEKDGTNASGTIKGKAGKADISLDTDPDSNPFLSLDLKTRQQLAENAATAARDPDRYFQTLSRWAPRVGFVLAPLFAIMLAATFFWRRGVYLYDHLVVSLHYHAFLYLFLTILIPFGMFNSPGWPIAVFLLWSNFYLYRLHRRVYGCGRFTAILRTVFVDSVYGIVLLLAMLALLMLGFVFI